VSGIYFHIPFCKKACHYCDFHFSTNLERKHELVQAMLLELGLRKNYLPEKKIDTIYFGGGTPSLLTSIELISIFERAHELFDVDAHAEITLEANPDDLSLENLLSFKQASINRLSIGIQSFNDKILSFLNRAHNADMSIASVKNAQQLGFQNISIDLIYAIPGQSKEDWMENIRIALSLKPQHISCYSLTIEKRTAFGNWLKNGKLTAVEEEEEAVQLELLVKMLTSAGYIQYEVSNFCLPGFESKHNSSYWQQKYYLGVGPSAHSFDGDSRQWNIKNNHLYIKSISEGIVPQNKEVLSREDNINEYLLTRLRTQWGCNMDLLKNKFGADLMNRKPDYIQMLVKSGLASIENGHLKLSSNGLLLADKISSDLFI
jgi:oxygen-independent coproporphyrinogen III oxidase